jgi:integrase
MKRRNPPVVAQFVRIARKARLGYDDYLSISQQARKKLGLRRGRKERRLPQLLADGDLKRFFRAIQDCGDVQHEILLKLLFYTAVRVSELVHIEVGDVDLDVCKIFINRGKGAKDRYILLPASFRLCSKATCTPRRAIDIYSRLGGSGRSRHTVSSKLCKAIARRLALRSRCTRICSAIRC